MPGYGICADLASQDTAGPDGPHRDGGGDDVAVDRRVRIRRATPSTLRVWPGENWDLVIPPAPDEMPDYMSALDLNFVEGKRIGYNGDLVDG